MAFEQRSERWKGADDVNIWGWQGVQKFWLSVLATWILLSSQDHINTRFPLIVDLFYFHDLQLSGQYL